MAVFLIFLFIDVLMVVIFHAVYGGRKTFSDGMLLGVHIPRYAVEDRDVASALQGHSKRSSRFYMLNLLVSIGISFLSFWYMSIFLIVWILWLVELVAGAMWILYYGHKKLYQIKTKRGWQGASGSKIVILDTKGGASGGMSPLYADDDIFWVNGWYSNPSDKRILVQNRYCSVNYTANMAHPAARILTFGILGLVLVMMIWLCGALLKIDFTPIRFYAEGDKITISAPMYPIEFDRADIQGVELLDELPDDSFIRTHGLDDSKQLIGEFRGRETGECRLYIQKKNIPVLKIVLPEYTVFINSKEQNRAENWYLDIAAEEL